MSTYSLPLSDAILCRPETTIREMLERLDALSRSHSLPQLFQLVADAEGKLLGTVTDGDIRRAMLRGAELGDPATRCMHTTPITGAAGDDAANQARLRELGGHITFLPILDPAGVLRSVMIATQKAPRIERALVMAGGRGRRLGEHTRTTPKPLLPVNGKPILGHILDGLEAANVQRVYVSVHYLAEQVQAFVAERPDGPRVELLHEDEPLGTAGALSLLPPEERDSVLVVNGDVMTDCRFSDLLAFHADHGHDATIAVTRHDTEIPYGVISQSPDGLFLGIEEKPRLCHFVAAGIYYLTGPFLGMVTDGERLDMPDLLQAGRRMGLRIGLFPVHEYWRDVGRPADLEQAETDAARPR